MTLYIGDKQIAGLCKESSSPLGSIGQTILPIDESQGIYRYLNGQVISQVLFPEFTDKLKNAIQLYPIIACTEQEWQNIKTLSKRGQVGKFVIDDTNKSIRLPLVINAEGLKELSNWGTILNESLPNIKGHLVDPMGGRGGAEQWSGAFKLEDFNGSITTSAVDYDGYNITFDASRSSSTYQDDALVQEEAIQYPYYIKVGEEGATSVDITREIELNNPFSLFDCKYSDHELSNISWLRSNGQWNSGTVYANNYNLLLKLYNGTETIEGISVKALGDSTITDYDFVIDTANTQFKLPLLPMERVVVEEHTEGTQGYRIYNDGYCEQWGVAQSQTIQFIKTFKNTEYLLTTSFKYGGTDSTSNQWVTYSSKTVNSITLTHTYSAGYINAINWKVSGYLAEGQYTPCNNYKYYYVGETVQNVNLIDAGRIQEDLTNIKTHIVIDTYENGASGYRVWSDGYCEQWGIASAMVGYDNQVNVTFLKQYKDIYYNAQVTDNRAGTNGSYADQFLVVCNKSATGMSIYTNWAGSANYSQGKYGAWKTCGYLAQGQY